MRVNAHGIRNRPRKPEIAQFHGSVFVQEQVRRFHVPVDDPMAVAVREASQNLVRVRLEDERRERRFECLEVTLQVRVEVLEDES